MLKPHPKLVLHIFGSKCVFVRCVLGEHFRDFYASARYVVYLFSSVSKEELKAYFPKSYFTFVSYNFSIYSCIINKK